MPRAQDSFMATIHVYAYLASFCQVRCLNVGIRHGISLNTSLKHFDISF